MSNIEYSHGINNLSDAQLKKQTLVLFNIRKEVVKKKDLTEIDKVFKRFINLKKSAKGKLVILFAGYDDDSREIYNIKEIRDYVRLMFDKYPYMFYYISQIDSTYMTLFFCLCDVESITPINHKDHRDALFDGAEVSRASIQYRIPEEISEKLYHSTLEHGVIYAEDTPEAVSSLISNILTEKSRNIIHNSRPDYSNIDDTKIMETYKDVAFFLWESLLKKANSISPLPEFMALSFISQNPDIISIGRKSPFLVTFISNPQRNLVNLFYIREHCDGPICPQCGTKHIILFKANPNDFSRETSALLPRLDNYFAQRVLPHGDEFLYHFPIPINYQKDKWICPNCMKMHKFSYTEERGILYN